RPTTRTQVMYGPPGAAYVYFIYGMHYCLNVVTAPPGCPEAVLIRALEPVWNLDLMSRRRFHISGKDLSLARLRQLANGPGKLTQALAISREQYGWLLYASPLRIYSETANGPAALITIAAGPRIGVDYAQEAKDYPWRFGIAGNAFLSKPIRQKSEFD
ncbi:MAG: DNA-3-methyladenine glycosylase, partial [Firmicutes bacterium]|nr:DNA-3-methyladenine glycosylase [Bacillota bacterium]